MGPPTSFRRTRSGLLVPGRSPVGYRRDGSPVWPVSGGSPGFPTFQSFSTYNASILTPTTYAPNMAGAGAWVAGDILFAIFETDTSTHGATAAGGSETWTQMSWSPLIPTGIASALNVWWARCSQTDPTAPTFSFSTAPNHAVGAVCAIRGCVAVGNPWDVDNTGTNTVVDATIPGAVTTVVETLVLVLCSSGFNGTNANRFTAWTNANLANLTERFDQVDTIGNGGGFGAATGEWASTGDYGNTTVTEGFLGHAYASIALKPAVVAGRAPAPAMIGQAVQRAGVM